MNFTEFFRGYIECAKWAEQPDDDNRDWARLNFEDETYLYLNYNAKSFWEKSADLFHEGLAEKAGHNFWLSHNEHGAGFFDSPEVWGNVADDLDELARTFPPIDLARNRNRLYTIPPWTYLLRYADQRGEHAVPIISHFPVTHEAIGTVSVACAQKHSGKPAIVDILERIPFAHYVVLDKYLGHMDVTDIARDWRTL